MVKFPLFRAEVKKQLSLRNWTYKDLAMATGYKYRTIEAFMNEKRVTDNVARAIAEVLDIPEHLAS